MTADDTIKILVDGILQRENGWPSSFSLYERFRTSDMQKCIVYHYLVVDISYLSCHNLIGSFKAGI